MSKAWFLPFVTFITIITSMMKTVGTEHRIPVGAQGKQTSHHLESTRGNKPGSNVSTG